MTDGYWEISQIANDPDMTERLRACVTQQVLLGNATLLINDSSDRTVSWFERSVLIASAIQWVERNRYVWAASPTWGEKWAYALNLNSADPNYKPGRDSAVITDADILSAVQSLTSRS